MRAGFLALAGVLLALGYFLPAVPTGVPQGIEMFRNVALVVITALLAVEALVLSRRAKRHHEALVAEHARKVVEAQAASSRHQATIVALQRDTIAMQAKLNDLTRRNAEHEKKQDELRRAYEDARAKLARVELDLKQKLTSPADGEVVGLLSLLQLKGRFIDFVMDDITKYPDAQVGAAARVVHQGCAAVVHEYFDIKPVDEALEGATMTLDKDYDARRYRLLGRVTGEPPFHGRLLHRGWLTTAVKLPETVAVADAATRSRGIIAPAEVELH